MLQYKLTHLYIDLMDLKGDLNLGIKGTLSTRYFNIQISH